MQDLSGLTLLSSFGINVSVDRELSSKQYFEEKLSRKMCQYCAKLRVLVAHAALGLVLTQTQQNLVEIFQTRS